MLQNRWKTQVFATKTNENVAVSIAFHWYLEPKSRWERRIPQRNAGESIYQEGRVELAERGALEDRHGSLLDLDNSSQETASQHLLRASQRDRKAMPRGAFGSVN